MQMDRRTFLIGGMGVAGALALGGLGACATEEEEEGQGPQGPAAQRPSLRLPADDAGFPSPFAYMRGPGYIKSSFIYDTLMWKDTSGRLHPWLAESFQRSDDGRSYTFRLRDAKWHDGRPVTAEDVAFTFNYFKSQTLPPPIIIQPHPEIAEVRATDPRTVEFRLANPLATFLKGYDGVGAVPIVPRHIWSSIQRPQAETNPAVLVGSGPYRLESYSRGEGTYLYNAHDGFFLGRPFVSRLEYRPVGDDLAAVTAGEVNAASARGVRPVVLDPFRNNPNLEVLEGPPGNLGTGLWWNLARGGALADVRFRHACARAIDRRDMVQRLHGGNAEPGNPGWIPPANPFHVPVEQYPFDRAAAESMLDSAGYRRIAGQDLRQGPDGRPLRFTLLVAQPVPPVTELVVQFLRAVGVELTPQSLDTPAFNQRVTSGGSEMSIIGFGGMNTDHGNGGYLRQVYSSKTRTTQHAQGYVNPEVDRLCDEQDRLVDESRRKEVVGRIQRLVAQDLPLLPLVYPDSFTIYDKRPFDQWSYTQGGVGSTVPTVENKQVFVTGRKTGLDIRPVRQGS